MSIQTRVRTWWKAVARRRQFELDVQVECESHIEAYAEDLTASGMTREAALRTAKMELGTTAVQQEECRRSLGLRLWDDLLADLRYGIRQLWRTPAFTITVVLVLALGTGVNAAMFSIIDATLLRWLPYHRAQELASIHLVGDHGAPWWAFYQDIVGWQQRSQSFSGMAYYSTNGKYVVTSGGLQKVDALYASYNLFDVLGVRPAMGRSFLTAEQESGKADVAVLSDAVWRRLFAADPEIVGKQIKLDDRPFTVVGIMSADFAFPADSRSAQIWLPTQITPVHFKQDFSQPRYQVIARLKKGISLSSATAELSGIEASLVEQYPEQLKDEGVINQVVVKNYRSTLDAAWKQALLAMFGAVLVVWLIACANVANLMLARSMARQREIAVRGALGASRSRVIRQLFTESLLLSLLGTAIGLGLAQLSLLAFSKTLAARLHLDHTLAPDIPVLLSLLGLGVVSALLFGLLPAWLASRTSLERTLRQGSSQAGAARKHHRLQQFMVVAEIALSLLLLVSCGLLLRTVSALRKVPLGFRADHVLTMDIQLPHFRYQDVDLNAIIYQPLLERTRNIPGVQSASLTTLVPLQKGFTAIMTMYLERDKKTGAPRHIDAQIKAVGPELQQVLGFGMLRGRFFNNEDTPDSIPVAVVNRAFADLYLSEGDVMGKALLKSNDRDIKVVGVIDDFHQAAIDKPSFPEIDFCACQMTPSHNFYDATIRPHAEIAIRTSLPPEQLIPVLRKTMLAMNPDLQDTKFATMDQVIDEAMGSQLLAAHLLELFAGSALAVALVGLYGLLAYLVAQRKHELGVRLALGAQRRNIMEMLLGQAGKMILAGAVLGIILAWAGSRVLADFLYGVKPNDVATLAGVTVLLIAAGLFAAYLPARRGAHVDPMEALRNE